MHCAWVLYHPDTLFLTSLTQFWLAWTYALDPCTAASYTPPVGD